jgi:hypothetical protein
MHQETDSSRNDRIAGCFVGLAVGDALGAPLEFLSRGQVRKHYPEGLRDMIDSSLWKKRAAKQLEQAGVHAGTLQGFLARGQNAELNPEQKRLFFIDESSLASTNQMRDFFQRLGTRDRVLLIGDTRQHQGVEAGRPFEQLQPMHVRLRSCPDAVAKLSESKLAVTRQS